MSRGAKLATVLGLGVAAWLAVATLAAGVRLLLRTWGVL